MASLLGTFLSFLCPRKGPWGAGQSRMVGRPMFTTSQRKEAVLQPASQPASHSADFPLCPLCTDQTLRHFSGWLYPGCLVCRSPAELPLSSGASAHRCSTWDPSKRSPRTPFPDTPARVVNTEAGAGTEGSPGGEMTGLGFWACVWPEHPQWVGGEQGDATPSWPGWRAG